MPDDNDPNKQKPSGGAYSAGDSISDINVADEIKNSFLDYSMSVIKAAPKCVMRASV